MTTYRRAGFAACLGAALLVSNAAAQSTQATQSPVVKRSILVSDGHSRILDPKLAGGGADFAFHLEGTGSLAAQVRVLDGTSPIATVWTGTHVAGAPPTSVFWDGTAGGQFVDVGDYALRVSPQAGPGPVLTVPVSVVRLGITEIEFQDSAAGNDEWQMVYFKKNALDGQFFATPAIHEYLCTAESGEASDLDLDSGAPRPAVAIHTATDEPVMQGTAYETDSFNYPLSYLAGASPRLEVTFGNSATTASGQRQIVGYPVAGFDIRATATFSTGGSATSGPILPGGTATFDGDPLTAQVDRTEVTVTWTWEYAPAGGGAWTDVPGSFATTHRFYTLIGAPKFKAGASGTKYTGPWVEVADYLSSWKNTLGIDTSTEAGVVEAHVKGFVGQNGGIPTAIEGVVYDAYPLGGDGGATHYHSFGSWNMDLSALLNDHAKGIYVNCSDNMGATTTMLSMMGVENVRPVRLGPMTLNAIWGIGAPGYTLSLWGTAHSFSYHHIVTRTDGFSVIDTCMQLDADGNPGALPGTPGWNVDRIWTGPTGYDDLSSTNTVSTSLENLPGLN